MTHVVVIGDALVDRDWSGDASRLCPDSAAPIIDLDQMVSRAGGAALAAVAVASSGGAVTLVTAIASDEAGVWLTSELARRGVDVVDLGLDGATPEKIRVRSAGATVARIDRNCRPIAAPGSWTDAASAAVRSADALLLADYGRGMVGRLPDDIDVVRPGTPVVWDPHPRGTRPRAHVDIATPSLSDAAALASQVVPDLDRPTAHGLAAFLSGEWGHAVVVTCGAQGSLLHEGGQSVHVPTRAVEGDPCGAGDWFAAGLAMALADGVETRAAVEAGSAMARAWVAGRGEPTVVATSGCFDVLHVGHLAMLEHARALGDRLVVLVNSDESVRRLKGSGRPVNRQEDRVALLAGMSCVDEVRVFDELTPCAALERLRPAVFVKGEDYRDVALPEAEVMAKWGGRIELAPFVPDRSTTRVLRLAQRLVG